MKKKYLVYRDAETTFADDQMLIEAESPEEAIELVDQGKGEYHDGQFEIMSYCGKQFWSAEEYETPEAKEISTLEAMLEKIQIYDEDAFIDNFSYDDGCGNLISGIGIFGSIDDKDYIIELENKTWSIGEVIYGGKETKDPQKILNIFKAINNYLEAIRKCE